MQNKTHIPYTYLIGWPDHNKWYYGVRYARGCKPSDLWTVYKTSSNYVAKFIEQFGDPTIIQIRKVFVDVTKARMWETRVLIRMKVVQNNNWLNMNDARSINPNCAPRGGRSLDIS